MAGGHSQADEKLFKNCPLLVATPYLNGTAYAQKVVLLVEHTPQGARGVMINDAFQDFLRRRQKATADTELSGPLSSIQVGVVHWGPGQLERELSSGVWLKTQVERDQVLAATDDIWQGLLCEIGRAFYRSVLGIRHFPPTPSSN